MVPLRVWQHCGLSLYCPNLSSFKDIAATVAHNLKQQCLEQSETISKTGANVAAGT